jgi:hypothetical protein
MNLACNRYSIAVLVALICMLLVSLVSVLVVNVPSTRAGTCGTYMVYTWTCRHTCASGPMKGCPSNCQNSCYHCYKKNVQHWVNPVSDQDMGGAGGQFSCSPISNNCPTFCQP